MIRVPDTPGQGAPRSSPGGADGERPDDVLRRLFHRLNNQLGIILAHAELIEAKAADDGQRARAAQIVGATLEAMSTAREIRQYTDPFPA